jgi:methyltransferase (TIGR00027 family)
MRVLHQMFDDEPKILEDPIAVRLVDKQSTFKLNQELLERLPGATTLRFKSAFVIRSRYAEDCLAESLSNGVRGYLVLGAGLDTFAYRQPPWADSLRVFEVDHPATQRWKRRRLAEAGISVPRNVTFVPVDFEKISLAAGWSQAGLDFAAPTFFSLRGVSQYLREDALDQTLRVALSALAGSEIVFSFVTVDQILPPDDAAVVRELVARNAAIGEPWISRFLPEKLITKLTAMGIFHRIAFITRGGQSALFSKPSGRPEGAYCGTNDEGNGITAGPRKCYGQYSPVH